MNTRRLVALGFVLIAVLYATFGCAAPAHAQETPRWLKTVTTASLMGAGIAGCVEIVASEAGIQKGTISEANRFLPDGKSANDTAGRALLKASGTAGAIYIVQRTRQKNPWYALGTAVGLAAWNGWLAANAMDHLRRGERR